MSMFFYSVVLLVSHVIPFYSSLVSNNVLYIKESKTDFDMDIPNSDTGVGHSWQGHFCLVIPLCRCIGHSGQWPFPLSLDYASLNFGGPRVLKAAINHESSELSWVGPTLL